MERYDPEFICNRSDEGGRYDYRSQPDICKWNLERLADALEPHLERSRLTEALDKQVP